MEDFCRQAAFKGTNNKLKWGGLPMVILVGDDYQLPSIDEGAFYCFGKSTNNSKPKLKQIMYKMARIYFKSLAMMS